MKPRTLPVRGALLRRQAKAVLSKVLLVAASGRERVTAVEIGVPLGGRIMEH